MEWREFKGKKYFNKLKDFHIFQMHIFVKKFLYQLIEPNVLNEN